MPNMESLQIVAHVISICLVHQLFYTKNPARPVLVQSMETIQAGRERSYTHAGIIHMQAAVAQCTTAANKSLQQIQKRPGG